MKVTINVYDVIYAHATVGAESKDERKWRFSMDLQADHRAMADDIIEFADAEFDLCYSIKSNNYHASLRQAYLCLKAMYPFSGDAIHIDAMID